MVKTQLDKMHTPRLSNRTKIIIRLIAFAFLRGKKRKYKKMGFIKKEKAKMFLAAITKQTKKKKV